MLTWSTMLRRRPRLQAKPQQQVVEADGVVLDVSRRRLHVDGHLVHLPAREAAVLGLLMAHAGQVVYRAALTEATWGTDPAHHNDVDRLIRRLRRRIQPSPLSPARLRRVGDTGYTFGCAPD
jgi:DNA-binding response OmpR family regulator